jgi:hypothetical protein
MTEHTPLRPCVVAHLRDRRGGGPAGPPPNTPSEQPPPPGHRITERLAQLEHDSDLLRGYVRDLVDLHEQLVTLATIASAIDAGIPLDVDPEAVLRQRALLVERLQHTVIRARTAVLTVYDRHVSALEQRAHDPRS